MWGHFSDMQFLLVWKDGTGGDDSGRIVGSYLVLFLLHTWDRA